MKETLKLTRILLKNSFNKNINDRTAKKKNKAMTALLLFAIAYIVGIITYFSYEIINILSDANQEQAFLSICLMASIGVTLIRTILTSLNVLYFSKDIEFLLPLPIKPIKIVLSKFNVMLVSEYITELITFGIPFIVYGYVMQVDMLFYIYSLLTFLFLPIIPMLLSILVIVIIMKFTKFLNNKDIVQYISVFLTIVIIIGIQLISSSSNEITDFMIRNKLLEINGLVDVFSKYFFTLEHAMNAMDNIGNFEGLKNIVLLAGESIIAYLFVAYGISKIYIESAINATSSGVKSKNRKLGKLSKQNIGVSYVKKEFKNLFRNPTVFLQCVLPSILFPIIFSMPIYNALTSSDTQTIDILKSSLLEVTENTIGIGIIFIIINFLYMFNYISVTAISREGENAIFMKYIPVELHKQCKYKVLPSVCFNMIPLIYVLAIIKILAPGVLWITMIEIFIVGLLSNILISYLTILIDLLRPKLHWTSEYSVVKQNMNMLYSSILVLTIIGITFFISAYIESIHALTILLSLIIIFVLVCYEMFLKKFSRQIFAKIS